MPDSSNPFHLWLGMPRKATNPTHYQLLAVKSNEKDADVIKSAARKRLNQLEEVDPGSHKEAHARLIERVRKAYKILSDSKLRSEYDAALRKTVEKTRKKRAAAIAGEPEPVSDVALPPESPAAIPTATPVEPDDQPAIPMATPVASISQPAAADLPVNDGDAADIGKLKQLKTRRRKKSKLVPILATVFCIAGVAGIVFTINSYGFLASAFEEEEEQLPQDVQDAIEEERRNARNSEETGNGGVLDPVDDDEAGEPDVDDSSSSDAEPEENSTDWASEENVSSDNGEVEDADQPPEVELAAELTFAQEVQYRCALQRARSAMYRRDKQTADRELARALELFKGIDDQRLPPRSRLLKEIAQSDQQVKIWLEGFWEQVLKSATSVGTREVEANGQIVSLVEGTDRHCIFRIGGRNVTYSYEVIPSALALAVAELGAKDDVPTWRLQKAAFYVVHRHLNPDHGSRAIDIARMSAADGHDPMPIENVVRNLDLEEFGLPENRIAAADPDDIEGDVVELLAGAGINRINRLSKAEAESKFDEIYHQAVSTQDPERRQVALEAAYQVAVRTCDIRNANDVLNELNYWVDIPIIERRRDAMLTIAKSDLDQRTAWLLLDEATDLFQDAQGTELADVGLDDEVRELLVRVAVEHDLIEQAHRLSSDD